MTTTNEITLREPMQLTSSNVERIFRESMAESTHKTPHIRGVLIDFFLSRLRWPLTARTLSQCSLYCPMNFIAAEVEDGRS